MISIFIGIVIAFGFWFVMFSPYTAQKVNFWAVMFLAAVTLSTYSFLSLKKKLFKLLNVNLRFIILGLFFAILLYFIFFFGKFLVSNLFDFSQRQIAAVYLTKENTPAWIISLLLLFVIGPAEEIFWRGFVLTKLREFQNRPYVNLLVSTFLYTMIHIWAFNFMLLVAAFVCGLFWGYIYLRYKSLVPGIISHSLWDYLVFILFPFS